MGSLSTHVCVGVQLVGVGHVGRAQMSAPWCWFGAFVCCELLDNTGLRLLLLELLCCVVCAAANSIVFPVNLSATISYGQHAVKGAASLSSDLLCIR